MCIRDRCYGSRSPWDAATMTDLCTAGYSEYGAAAPPFRDCRQEAIDSGNCGDTSCVECDGAEGSERGMMIYGGDSCTDEIGADGFACAANDGLDDAIGEDCPSFAYDECYSLVDRPACVAALKSRFSHWTGAYGDLSLIHI